jgi:hypothetical protein
MTFLCKELFNYQGNLYYIHKKIKESSIPNDTINELKEYWGCTTVIKQKFKQTNETFLLFLVEIEDAKIIDEEKN